jgi:HK97 family phage prohead protease
VSKIEERRLTTQTIEATEDRTIVGYAAVFNSRSQDLGGFYETIHPSAFKKTLQETDARSFWNHDQSKPLGRMSAGTLRLETDERGLRYEVDVPKTTYGDDLLESIRRGDVKESSFGFRTIDDDWEMEDGMPVRMLKEVALAEVSPVSIPAYQDATVGTRRALERLAEKRGLSFDEVEHNIKLALDKKTYVATRRDSSAILLARLHH